MRPRLLDLFCGAGGTAMGYYRAGFEVVGVDIKLQPRFPFEFQHGDAMEYPLGGFDVIHASPPCQRFTALKDMHNALPHDDLLTPTRALLKKSGLPYVIENVVGAPMQNYITLCGTMFGLGTDTAELWRHRRFEVEPLVLIAPPCAHRQKQQVIGVYGGHGRDGRRKVNTQNFTVAQRREAMGIGWMAGNELSQAIPPAYTEWIGRRILDEGMDLSNGDTA